MWDLSKRLGVKWGEEEEKDERFRIGWIGREREKEKRVVAMSMLAITKVVLNKTLFGKCRVIFIFLLLPFLKRTFAWIRIKGKSTCFCR